MIDKTALANAIKSNNRNAIGQMLLDIASIVIAREPTVDIHDRDDRRQDLALYMLMKLDNVNPDDNPLAYLWQVAYRRLLKIQTRSRSKLGHRARWEAGRCQELQDAQRGRP